MPTSVNVFPASINRILTAVGPVWVWGQPSFLLMGTSVSRVLSSVIWSTGGPSEAGLARFSQALYSVSWGWASLFLQPVCTASANKMAAKDNNWPGSRKPGNFFMESRCTDNDNKKRKPVACENVKPAVTIRAPTHTGCGQMRACSLVHLKWNDHLENGDIDLERLFIIEVFHGIATIHLAHFCTEITAADILISLA